MDARRAPGAVGGGGGMSELAEAAEWPRFEDGAPVRFGDLAQVRDDIGAVVGVNFYERGWEVVIGFEGSSYASHYHFHDQEFSSVDDGERVRRWQG